MASPHTVLIDTGIWGAEPRAKIVARIVQSIITAVITLSLAIATIGRDLDVHNWIDKHTWKLRSRVGKKICEELVEAARISNASNWQNMQGKDSEVLKLFYKFINEQTVLRPLAFTYWEQYFVNLYMLVLCATGFVCNAIIEINKARTNCGSWIVVFFMIALILYFLRTKYSLIPKILELPVQQIAEIKSGHGSALKSEVESRFSRIVIP